MTTFSEQRAALQGLHGLMGRAAAKAAGLKIFNGPECPVRAHGRMRRITDGRCVCCLEAVVTMKQDAQQAGRAAALKAARAEVARELRREERAKAKAEAQAVKAQQLEERRKAAMATKRAASRAERSALPSPAAVVVEALEDLEEGVEDDSPPWD